MRFLLPISFLPSRWACFVLGNFGTTMTQTKKTRVQKKRIPLKSFSLEIIFCTSKKNEIHPVVRSPFNNRTAVSKQFPTPFIETFSTAVPSQTKKFQRKREFFFSKKSCAYLHKCCYDRVSSFGEGQVKDLFHQKWIKRKFHFSLAKKRLIFALSRSDPNFTKFFCLFANEC